LKAADQHADLFPEGALTEEREAIAIQALLGLDKRDLARVRALRFTRRFPGSLFSPLISDALRDG
jgi:hypothetical protein